MVLLVLLYHGVRVSIITVFELYCTVLYGMIQCDFLENLRWLMMLVMWVHEILRQHLQSGVFLGRGLVAKIRTDAWVGSFD